MSMNGAIKKKARPPLTEAAILETLHQKYPFEATALVHRLQRFIREYASEDTRKYLTRTGFGNSLEVFERVKALMDSAEREQRDKKENPDMPGGFFDNSPEMDRAQAQAFHAEMAEAINHAINSGKDDFIANYGGFDETELVLAQNRLHGGEPGGDGNNGTGGEGE